MLYWEKSQKQLIKEMARLNVGDRAGAIVSTNQKDKTATLFGYGIYQGEEVPPADERNPMMGMLHENGIKNPKITLDSGEDVWGCECWWGPEDMVQKHLEGYTTTTITREQYYAGK